MKNLILTMALIMTACAVEPKTASKEDAVSVAQYAAETLTVNDGAPRGTGLGEAPAARPEQIPGMLELLSQNEQNEFGASTNDGYLCFMYEVGATCCYVTDTTMAHCCCTVGPYDQGCHCLPTDHPHTDPGHGGTSAPVSSPTETPSL